MAFLGQGCRKGVPYILVSAHFPTVSYPAQLLYLTFEPCRKENGQGGVLGTGRAVIYKAHTLGTLVLDNNYSPLINSNAVGLPMEAGPPLKFAAPATV